MPDTRPAPVATPAAPGGSRFWLIPAVTFLVGLLLGAVVVGATHVGDPAGTDGALAAPSSSPTATGRPDLTVVVPASCLEALDRAERAVDSVRAATEAIKNLDAAALRTVVDQLQQLRSRVTEQADLCRAAAARDATS